MTTALLNMSVYHTRIEARDHKFRCDVVFGEKLGIEQLAKEAADYAAFHAKTGLGETKLFLYKDDKVHRVVTINSEEGTGAD